MNKNPRIAYPPTAASKMHRRPAFLAASIACALGLVAGFAPRASAQNLITNGGFETGNLAGWAIMPAFRANSFFGVTSSTFTNQVGFGTFAGPAGASAIPVHSGNFEAFFGATARQFDGISQSFNTIDRPLLKGVYQVSYWLKAGAFSGTPSQFQALWNGSVIYNTVNTPPTPYQLHVINEVATGKTSTLGFQGFNIPGAYYLDDVSVTLVKLEQGSFAPYAQTPNQRAVASAVDRAGFNPATSPVLQYLDYRDLKQLPGDFDRISPDQLTSIFTIGTALAQEQSLNVQRRNDDIRSGSSGFSAAGLAINTFGPSYNGGFGVAGPSGDDGKEVKETKQVVPAENRWGTFLSGTGEWVSVGDTNNARGYDLASGGFTLGIDYKVTPNFAVGLMGGYTGTTADLNDHGRVWVNGGSLGVYATFFQNEAQPAPTMSKDSSKEAPPPAPSIAKGFYADIAASGGYNSYDTRRSALQGDARGDTDGGDINALFGVGYDFKAGGLTFGPTGSFNYTYTGINGFNETGSLAPLNIHGGDGESLRSAFGFKASYDWKVGGIVIKPELRAAWQHEYGDAAYALDSSLASGAGGTFTVNGPRLGRDSALLGAGFAIQCSERCSTYFYYDGELGRKNYQSSSVTGGVRLAF